MGRNEYNMHNTILNIRLKILFVFLFCCIGAYQSYASHLVGGDIRYRCLGGNNFEITFVLYQDCLSGNADAIRADNPLEYAIYRGINKTIFHSSGNIRTNTGIDFIPAEFSNECINNPPVVCLQKMEFTTIMFLPPSTTGYRILYQRCCRNTSILNVLNSGNTGVTYYVDIPPFENNECSNNNIVFKNFPPQIICENYPFMYDFSATDIDGDSLSYRLCAAYPGASRTSSIPQGMDIVMPSSPLQYAPPYSATTPMSAFPALSIDPITGMMTGTPTRSGRYVVTVCVDEWRNGVLINTTSRDAQFTVTNCTKAVVANMPMWRDDASIYTVECSSNTVKFKNTSIGGFTYLWKFGVNGATSSAFEPEFTYPDTGTYEVTLIVNPGSTCTDSIKRLVKVYPVFEVDFETSGILCPETPIEFDGVINATNNIATSYFWSFSGMDSAFTEDATFTFPSPGGPQTVLFTATSNWGCIDTVIKTVNLDVVDINAGNDTIIVLGYDFFLNATGADNVFWEPTDFLSDPNSSRPKTSFPDTGTYTYVVQGSTEKGCTSKDSITIRVVKSAQMFLPNAFSPNGDGLNDLLRPTIVGYSLINTFEVFNRFGELVFKSSNSNTEGWDGTYRGKDADVGVYYYRVTFTDPFSRDRHEQTGDVTLIR